jgi:hypothetical protein
MHKLFVEWLTFLIPHSSMMEVQWMIDLIQRYDMELMSIGTNHNNEFILIHQLLYKWSYTKFDYQYEDYYEQPEVKDSDIASQEVLEASFKEWAISTKDPISHPCHQQVAKVKCLFMILNMPIDGAIDRVSRGSAPWLKVFVNLKSDMSKRANRLWPAFECLSIAVNHMETGPMEDYFSLIEIYLHWIEKYFEMLIMHLEAIDLMMNCYYELILCSSGHMPPIAWSVDVQAMFTKTESYFHQELNFFQSEAVIDALPQESDKSDLMKIEEWLKRVYNLWMDPNHKFTDKYIKENLYHLLETIAQDWQIIRKSFVERCIAERQGASTKASNYKRFFRTDFT